MWTATSSRTNARAADASTATCTSRLWAACTAPLATARSTKLAARALIRDGVTIAVSVAALSAISVLCAGAILYGAAVEYGPRRKREE
jgi:hypothetical protein